MLFIISDDTPPAYLGCFDGLVPTPRLEGLRREGVRFGQAFCSSSVSQPSRWSYLTGQYAGRCPDPQFLDQQDPAGPSSVEFNVHLNPAIPSTGWLFQRAGYRTGLTGKWHAGFPAEELPLPPIAPDADLDDPSVDAALRERQAAYQRYVCESAGFDYAGGIIMGNNSAKPVPALNGHHIEWSVQAAMDFLDTCTDDQPFYLHYASTCNHGPDAVKALDDDPRYTRGGKMERVPDCLPPRTSLPGRLKAMGLAVNHETVSFLWLDDQVGALIDKLDAKGWLDNTIIVYGADHGNEPGKCTCFDKGTHIPLIIRPARPFDGGGRDCDQLAQNIDLLPTLLEMCGIEAGPGWQPDGRSLVPLIRGEAKPVHDELFFEMGYLRAIRTKRWKYIALRYPRGDIERMAVGAVPRALTPLGRERHGFTSISVESFPHYYDADQLYDLEADPREQHNLADDPAHRSVLAEMRGRMRGYLQTLPHPYPLDDAEQAAFLRSERFAGLADRVREEGTGYVGWWDPAWAQAKPW